MKNRNGGPLRRLVAEHFRLRCFVDMVDTYLDRYNMLCRKLAQERLYTTATVLASPRTAANNGEYVELSELTGLTTLWLCRTHCRRSRATEMTTI